MFVNDDIYYFLSDMTENEKWKEGDYLMTCSVTHVSLLSFHIFFRNSCFTKSLSFTTRRFELGIIGFLLTIETLIIILATCTKRSVVYHGCFKMTDVIQRTHDAIAAVTEDDWVSSCRHVEEVERKYWDADIAVTKTQTPQQSAQTIPTQNQQTKIACADLFCIVKCTCCTCIMK